MLIIRDYVSTAYPISNFNSGLIDFANPMLLNALMALASRFLKSPKRGETLRREGEAYFMIAAERSGEFLAHGPSYTSVAALCMMSLWCVVVIAKTYLEPRQSERILLLNPTLLEILSFSYSKYMELLTIIGRTYKVLLDEADMQLSGDLVQMHSLITAQRNALDSDLNA
eukprot:jgi/Hompol1/3496/HPOL_006573-RA